VTARGTILLVEDDAQMRRFLRTTLRGHGFRLAEAATLMDGEAALRAEEPDLVLLDLGLPDGDGIELVRALRITSRLPVIVLSARGREDDKVAALDAGADDYLTKPFGVAELLARIRVALRHARGAAGAEAAEILVAGPIRIDRSRHEVAVDGNAIRLTPIEFQLLSVLVQNVGRVLTHRQLLRHVWGPEAVEQTHYLRVHMAALRRKVERDPARPAWLLTEPGIGYRLRDAA
jgi:two-component system, OmpR family, KDP operon response regulator KdpE